MDRWVAFVESATHVEFETFVEQELIREWVTVREQHAIDVTAHESRDGCVKRRIVSGLRRGPLKKEHDRQRFGGAGQRSHRSDLVGALRGRFGAATDLLRASIWRLRA